MEAWEIIQRLSDLVIDDKDKPYHCLACGKRYRLEPRLWKHIGENHDKLIREIRTISIVSNINCST